MKKYMFAAMMVMITIISVNAQYGNQDYANNDDRYYYDNDFDWHWDIRVKISNGIQQGLLSQNESTKLYRILENVERKEYTYQADGVFSSWEQQDMWDNVIYLNQRLGIELNDYDRNFYGFDVYGYDRRGYNKWFYQGGYDFNRFDKRGFGSIRLGYVPRPNYNGWYRNNNNQIAHKYYSDRRFKENRGNNQGGNRDSRGNADYSRNRPSGNNYGRNNSQGNNGGRNDRVESPNNRPSNNGGGYSQGNGGRPERVEPNNNGWGNSQGNGGGRPERTEPNNNGGGRSERTEPNNRGDNANRGGGNNRSETPQSGGNGGHRGPR